ncbi:Uma2 family endonuclease [Streptomyces sp. NPDC056161]|uniref:Uma2 family endonuclease n=1 Tax=Streptomyces sp. NPDC056161 TaxID=3345732 RepID=UPI0035D6FE40
MTLMTERPVIDDVEPRGGFEELLDLLDQLNVPDGYKAEIVRGNIVVSPWSKGYYADVMDLVCDQLRPHLPEDHRITWGPLLYVFPGIESACGPDIHAAHQRVRRSTSNRLDGEALSFVAELTSPSTRDADLTDKVEIYGRAGVPVYLLLDMQQEVATVYWSPSDKGYQGRLTQPFGEKLHIPEPFDCVLDTDGFQAPAADPEDPHED